MDLTINKKKYYEFIDKVVKFNKVSHAYIIEVDNYEDDFICVMDFVKKILTKNDSSSNINFLVDNRTYPDLKIIEPDGSVIKKSQLMNLKEEFKNKSFLDNKMIYVIREADKLNDSSGNTMLKFLEEPEDDIVAILVTTNRYKIIETILSRCQILTIKEENILNDISTEVFDMLKFIVKKDDLFINYDYILKTVIPEKAIAIEVFDNIEKIFVSYLNFLSIKDLKLNDDIIKILSNVDNDSIVNYIAIIEEEIDKLEYNVNYKLWLDCLFARLIGG